jgi:hypothetical protein
MPAAPPQRPAFDIRRDVAPVRSIVEIIPLVVMTAFLILGTAGTVGKLLFDDWRVRRAMRVPVRPLPITPPDPSWNSP